MQNKKKEPDFIEDSVIQCLAKTKNTREILNRAQLDKRSATDVTGHPQPGIDPAHEKQEFHLLLPQVRGITHKYYFFFKHLPSQACFSWCCLLFQCGLADFSLLLGGQPP